MTTVNLFDWARFLKQMYPWGAIGVVRAYPEWGAVLQ